ncbi:MAG: hypothetical protein IT290_10230 [Deltaproteobacteria bacterium]|nr:hypothetical protein [Deltaproteobacteria bacterium]
MARTNFERAMVAARRSRPDEYEVVNRWLDRWQVALSVCYREETQDDHDVYDLIAPSEALNELPMELVSRYWQLRL